MGKKKFIEKKNAATLKMVYRPSDHLQTTKQNQDLPIFQVVPKPVRGDQEKTINLAELIEQKLNDGDYTTENYSKKPIKQNKKQNNASSLVKGRSDLWINHIQKQKEQQINSSDEDWEDEEEWHEEEINENDEYNFKKIEINPSVKMRRFDENGLPLDDGYDYSQHLQDQANGELVIAYYANANEIPHIIGDMDYQPEEMTEDQKEVFQVLRDERDDYEPLEDDFVALATGGEKCIIEQKPLEIKIIKDDQPYKNQQFQNHDYSGLENDFDDDNINDDNYDDDDDDDENLDIDSEAEREFEREMKAFDKKNNEKKVKFDDDLRFNQIIEDHIQVMKKGNRGPKRPFDEDEFDENDESDDNEEAELLELKKKDRLAYLKKKFPNTDPSEFYLPKDIPQLTLEQDIALQNYLNRESSSNEEGSDEVIEKDDETIVTRYMEQSQMSKMNPEQLNIIKWQQATKKSQKDKVPISQVKKNKQLEKQKKHEEQVQKIEQLVRNRDETKEEKKLRKELAKQLKNQQKEQKRVFKQAYKEISKNHSIQLNQNRENTNINGVSVIKVQ